MATITASVSPVFTVVANPRIFSKPIVKGKSLVSLSQEELESLTKLPIIDVGEYMVRTLKEKL